MGHRDSACSKKPQLVENDPYYMKCFLLPCVAFLLGSFLDVQNITSEMPIVESSMIQLLKT